MYALIHDRSGQHMVREGEVILCNLNAGWQQGDRVTFDRVLMFSREGEVRLGAPYIEGASVSGEVLGSIKGPRVISCRFKRRKNVRVKRGHRQPYTRVRITSIQAG